MDSQQPIKGYKWSESRKRFYPCGSLHHRWLGQKATYSAQHYWISRVKGKPKNCESCGATSGVKFEWANISGKYLRNVKDYRRLCIFCHRKFDSKGKCKRGHLFTEINTRITKRGSRSCRKCATLLMRIHRANLKAKQNL